MTETLTVRWKPGTLDRLLVTSSRGPQEWSAPVFARLYGRAALAELYLRGRTSVPALPAAPEAASASGSAEVQAA